MIGAAVLLLISSFLPFFAFDVPSTSAADDSISAWSSATFPMLPTVHLLALVVAGLFLAARTLPEGRKVLGLQLDQWGTAFAVAVAWSALWSMFATIQPDLGVDLGGRDPNEGLSLSFGAYLTLIFALALAAAAAGSSLVPALKSPLISATPKPQATPYGQQPQAGYGYPGGQQAPYGQQPQGGYGYPGGQQQPQAQQPGPAAGAGAPEPAFQPFWFAVPVARPLFGEDGSPQPVAELTPGTWYLAVEQRGQALVAQTQDGRRGVLQDTSGIQRG